jgi:pimeloyl-ACP methyl ester carboxylesterase
VTGWALLAALAPLGAPAQITPPAPVAQVEEVRLEVAGRSVRAMCTGEAPKVVLLHDAGRDADHWRRVLEWLAPGVSACAYDRGSLAGGDGEPAERGWLELLEDLLSVHAALGVEEEYVLVGQGEGAMYARLLAASRRGTPGGLVLLEPTHEDLPRLMRPAMPHGDWETWMASRAAPNTDGVRPLSLAARARSARVPAMPVTVVTATRREAREGWDVRFLDEAARRAHEELVRGRPFGRHVPAPGSGPDVSSEAPALVADEIFRILRIVEGS